MISENLNVNEQGHLTFAGHDTAVLAAKYGTPLYLMDERRIRERCRLYRQAMAEAFGGESGPLFASKALCFKHIYEIMREENMGIDVVSSGELYTAILAGFPAQRAYFHGNNKTDADIAFAMDNGIGHFVCDNADELYAIEREAANRGIRQKILLRLTPGIDPHTHEKITTGKVDSKFGAAIETGQAMQLTALALSMPHIVTEGFHCHIGSQIFDCAPFCDAARIMLRFMGDVKRELGFEATVLNLGGGMGVPYVKTDPVPDYAENIRRIGEAVRTACAEFGLTPPTVLMEPGRSIVADAGLTLYTVGGKK
ncbi:MAG: diaminopimelate decarboxylase, partial [Clostridia bacterium]|nr:diaminopimelate decarboxylase [Clostridia bacterium]